VPSGSALVARREGADEPVLRTLEQLPMDRFTSPNDVSEAYGKLT